MRKTISSGTKYDLINPARVKVGFDDIATRLVCQIFSIGNLTGLLGRIFAARRSASCNSIWMNSGTGSFHAFSGFKRASGRGAVVLRNSACSIAKVGAARAGFFQIS